MPADAPVLRFSRREGTRVVCTLCGDAGGRHGATCPLVALDAEIRALTGHVGMCVANIKDSLETIGRLLRDEGDREL
jgi:hypothetical protein